MSSLEVFLEQQRDVLTKNRTFIIRHLNPDDVIDDLIQAGTLIGENAAQRVQLPGLTRAEKSRIVVEELCGAGPESLMKFCEILKGKEKLRFIAEQLELELESKSRYSVNRFLCRLFTMLFKPLNMFGFHEGFHHKIVTMNHRNNHNSPSNSSLAAHAFVTPMTSLL